MSGTVDRPFTGVVTAVLHVVESMEADPPLFLVRYLRALQVSDGKLYTPPEHRRVSITPVCSSSLLLLLLLFDSSSN